MADPQAAVLSQLRNIEARTGRSIAELQAAVAATGLAKHGERRSWLMQQLQLGYGDANAVVSFMGKPLPALGACAAALVAAYESVRPFTPAEHRALPGLLRAAALRFWISRLWDWHLPRDAALLQPKDPRHFERVLRERIASPWHVPGPEVVAWH